ncbi:hypothetical protein KBD59_04995 [Candidatus Gracilibacteria bacterium]|nr:hypothetical protein [Candidatus Gracilibacteria bacterium]
MQRKYWLPIAVLVVAVVAGVVGSSGMFQGSSRLAVGDILTPRSIGNRAAAPARPPLGSTAPLPLPPGLAGRVNVTPTQLRCSMILTSFRDRAFSASHPELLDEWSVCRQLATNLRCTTLATLNNQGLLSRSGPDAVREYASCLDTMSYRCRQLQSVVSTGNLTRDYPQLTDMLMRCGEYYRNNVPVAPVNARCQQIAQIGGNITRDHPELLDEYYLCNELQAIQRCTQINAYFNDGSISRGEHPEFNQWEVQACGPDYGNSELLRYRCRQLHSVARDGNITRDYPEIQALLGVCGRNNF